MYASVSLGVSSPSSDYGGELEFVVFHLTFAMATEEWVKRAIENSKNYEDLPPKVRTVLPVAEWKAKYE